MTSGTLMFRSTVAGLAALGLVVSADLAEGKIDCAKTYKEALEKAQRDKFAKFSGEQLATLSRMTIRAYDACQAGDELNARALFERADAWDGGPGHDTGPRNPNLPLR